MGLQSLSKPIEAIACATCQTQLADYVRRQLNSAMNKAINKTTTAADLAVARHIESCPTCQARYFTEYRAQGLAKPLAVLQQVGQRAGVARALDQIVGASPPNWWQQVTATLQQLAIEITVHVQEATATFVDLPSALAPQRVAALTFRTQSLPEGRGAGTIELLTLPAPSADLQIKVSAGAVVNHKSTLILQLVTMTDQPIVQVRTTLRDHQERLLEQSASDSDGLVSFGELEPGNYSVQIKHGGQTWLFSVVLTT